MSYARIVVGAKLIVTCACAIAGCAGPSPRPQPLVEPPTRRVAPRPLVLDLGDGQTMELVWIPAGEFMMGGIEYRNGGFQDGCPKHRVRTERPFWMGKFEVTQAQWHAVMGEDASPFKCTFIGDNLPMQNVDWGLCQQFCEKLSKKIDRHVRLPSEAEWEYACRAGTDTAFNVGDRLTAAQANIYPDNSHERVPRATVAVGSYPPNAFGLYDMHGNVCEFCADLYHADFTDAPTDGRAWITGGDAGKRIFRGGSSSTNAPWCRSALRRSILVTHGHYEIGFRVIVETTPDEL